MLRSRELSGQKKNHLQANLANCVTLFVTPSLNTFTVSILKVKEKIQLTVIIYVNYVTESSTKYEKKIYGKK